MLLQLREWLATQLEKMIKIYNNQNAEDEINLLDRINNFFDKFLYKI